MYTSSRVSNNGIVASFEPVVYYPDLIWPEPQPWHWPGTDLEGGSSLIRESSLFCEGRLPDYEEITPNNDGPHNVWKSFEHYKVVVATNPSMNKIRVRSGQWLNEPAFHTGHISHPYFGYSAGTYGDGGRLNAFLPAMYAKRLDNGFVPEPSNLDMLKQKSLDIMLPLIKAELSLPNALYELRDFRTLPSMLANWWSVYNRLFQKGIAKRRTLRELSRSGAGGYLQAQFNILPLLSDIAAFTGALSRSASRIRDFITRAGRVQSKHFAYNWQEFDSSFESSAAATVGGRSVVLERRVVPVSTTFHAQIQYNYNYTEYQLAHAQVLAFLDAIGVNLNPQILWNAIPWSFVVDWVAGVSRFLGQFQTQNMRPQINIHRYLWSVKRSRDIHVTRRFVSVEAANATYSEVAPLPVISESAYRRNVGMPEVSSVIQSGLTLKEVSLAAALVIARRRSPKSAQQRWSNPSP